MTQGWPEDDAPGWSQQYDNEARRWHEERERLIKRCEAEMRVMREWPEYNPKLKGETDEHQ